MLQSPKSFLTKEFSFKRNVGKIIIEVYFKRNFKKHFLGIFGDMYAKLNTEEYKINIPMGLGE